MAHPNGTQGLHPPDTPSFLGPLQCDISESNVERQKVHGDIGVVLNILACCSSTHDGVRLWVAASVLFGAPVLRLRVCATRNRSSTRGIGEDDL